MKKLFSLLTAFLLITFISGYSNLTFCQEKEKEKAKKEVKVKKKGVEGGVTGGVKAGVSGGVKGGVRGGVAGGIEGGVQGGVQGGVIGGCSRIIDEDFIKEPIKIIALKVEHLEIRPTETVPLKGGIEIKTESGLEVKYVYGAISFPTVELEITPVIIEKKGIEIKIKVSQEGIVIKEETVFTRNYEPFIIELMEKKEKNIKLANKITPLIYTIEPAKMYPEPIKEIKMVNNIIFMNNELISRGGNLQARSKESKSIFLYFFIKEKGIFLLTFKPFKGAQPIGVVRDNIIKIKHNKDYFEWISMKPVLPEGKWLVWVRNNPEYDPAKDESTLGKAFSRKEGKFFSGIGTGEDFWKRFFK